MSSLGVIAFFSQETCRLYSSEKEVPSGALVVFTSPTNLSKEMSIKDMDATRRKILQQDVVKSRNKDEASLRLWSALNLMAEESREDLVNITKKLPTAQDRAGNRRAEDRTPLELIQLTYAPDEGRLVDVFYHRLCRQAKLIIDLLIEDEKGIWTAHQVQEILKKSEEEFKTRQGVEKIFRFYLHRLVGFNFVKKIKFIDAAKNPELATVLRPNELEARKL